MQEEKVFLTVLMPCLNEIKTLGSCIDKIHQACRGLKITYEILISDNGSVDGSVELAQNKGARVSYAAVKGYGAALRNGFREASGEYILFADADDTYDFNEIPLFVEELRKGHEVVIGSRIRGHIHSGAMPFLHRYLGTPVLTFLIRRLYHIPISDCNSGMRMLKKTVYESLDIKSTGMEFASEMLVKLGLLGVSIKEIPISLFPDRRGRPPHLKTWRDGWRHLRFILMYAPQTLLMTPGFFLFLFGTLGVCAFAGGALEFRGRIIDYHSQLVMATIGIVGFSMWSFGQLISFFSHVSDFARRPSRLGFYGNISLEARLAISLIFIVMGLIFFGVVFHQWWVKNFQFLHEVHKLVLSLYLIVNGILGSLLAATLFCFQYDQRK